MNENVKDANIELKDEERTKCEIWTRVMGYHRPILIKRNPLVASRIGRFFIWDFSFYERRIYSY